MIYDLKKDVRYTLTQNWDRSPDALAVRDFVFTWNLSLTCNSSRKMGLESISVEETLLE